MKEDCFLSASEWQEKERLEIYFKNVIERLPGGIAVIRCEKDGRMIPEYVSKGLADIVHMTVEEMTQIYINDVYGGMYPEDINKIRGKLHEYIKAHKEQFEFTGRMKKGGGGYVWVKCMVSLSWTSEGITRFYASYTNINEAMEEKEHLRRQYEEMILQHYRKPDPNALIIGHCNVTKDTILDIIDYTDSDLLKTFGTRREAFFSGIASFIVDEKERRDFLGLYLNAPALAAFYRNDPEQVMNCFIKLPKGEKGYYVNIRVHLVETPDTGDITGILTVTDITEQMISEIIQYQISITNYDFVMDLNIENDTYTALSSNKGRGYGQDMHGCFSERVAYMLQNAVVPKDQSVYAAGLNVTEMRKRLEQEKSYTITFSMIDEFGDVRTKNLIVSAIDLRLGRVCLLRNDITDSVREQQGMLNVVAYTFELMGIIDVDTERLVMYDRQTVLQNLQPYIVDDYTHAIERFATAYIADSSEYKDVMQQFQLKVMARKLEENPSGYDFVFAHKSGEELHYKQINILWGDENHKTICLVRADVTDILAAERNSKNALEKALLIAEEANRAKSEFLSAMSHDIRTPMNAIMGMTELAQMHMEDKERVVDCLKKIAISSRHLLSLINDVLDMSRIERSKIAMNCVNVSLIELISQITAIMEPQAKAAGVQLNVQRAAVTHEFFYGDSLRISQILINILSNAVKFTPRGGKVEFLLEEVKPVIYPERIRYRFTITDTGIGMSEAFMCRLFEPFSRNDDTSEIEGTGLGLSITKGLVDLMEGDIFVQSKEGQGSVFRVELECEKVREEEGRPIKSGIELKESLTEQIFSGRCFLVAEDNAINAEILCELLEMFGAKIILKTNGLKAVQAFCEADPYVFDAILMDIQMPEMNGYEATRMIRKMGREDARSIPIIAMTANAFAEDIQTAVEAGMTAHVAKPIDIHVLRSTLSRELNVDLKNGRWSR